MRAALQALPEAGFVKERGKSGPTLVGHADPTHRPTGTPQAVEQTSGQAGGGAREGLTHTHRADSARRET